MTKSVTSNGGTCRPTLFNPGDRVIYAGSTHGEFLRYSDTYRCPDSHRYHPGHRIAYFQPDRTPHPHTGVRPCGEWRAWECDLTAETLTETFRGKSVEHPTNSAPDSRVPTIRTYLGVSYVERETAWEVNVGDRIVCLLPDAVAAAEVTSITYRDLDLTALGLGHVVHVVFGYRNAPWWVDQQFMTAGITEPVCVAVTPADVTAGVPRWSRNGDGCDGLRNHGGRHDDG